MGPDAERNEAPSRKVYFLEPYYGGSHREIAEGFAGHSRHLVTLLTMPARHWKWRLRGSAYHLGEELKRRLDGDGAELIICSTPSDVSLLRARFGSPAAPILLYVHEHQFSYPTSTGDTPDANYPLTDLASALAADAVWFNSHWCRNAFLEGARALLGRMPDYRCRGVVDEVAATSRVVYPGVNPPGGLPEVAGVPAAGGTPAAYDVSAAGGVAAAEGVSATDSVPAADGTPAAESVSAAESTPAAAPPASAPDPHAGGPIILWNHRWEHDKSPRVFFEALEILDRPGLQWRLAVVGGAGRRVPEVFEVARTCLAHRIVQWGFIEDRAEYHRLLQRCHIVVSAARQENFGLAVLEAVRAGLHPVLPRRLSYPELYGGSDAHFYDEAGGTDHASSADEAIGTDHTSSADDAGGKVGQSGAAPEATRLAETLEAALNDPALHCEGARSARRRWAARYDWSNRIAEWDRGIEELIRRAGGERSDVRK